MFIFALSYKIIIMKLKLINTDKLEYIFDNLSIINYYIKRIDTGITKNSFYTLKSDIINYVLTLIKQGRYGNQCRYDLLEMNEQNVNDININLVCISINIKNKTHIFHQKVESRLSVILADDIEKYIGGITPYIANDVNYFEEENKESIQSKYINLINLMCEMDWCIYRILDNETFINKIIVRYNIRYKLVGGGNISSIKKDMSVKLKLSKCEYSEPIFLNELRYNTNSLIRFLFSQKKHNVNINYNIKPN